jgi:hypothetical protein
MTEATIACHLDACAKCGALGPFLESRLAEVVMALAHGRSVLLRLSGDDMTILVE